MSTSENNKRIAKNTLLLYFRMFFIMAISLYTSRIVLQALGVEDFGIYNVVGGVVSMLGFFNAAMSAATQRYLTFELGRKNYVRLNQIFSTCQVIYAFLAIIFLILAETAGLWFLENKMTIPGNRMFAVHWVYQFSILSCMISLLSTPYNAAIIAHERMNIYAYIGIIEVFLKLAIVYLLLILPNDNLIMYGLLMMLTSLITALISCIYSYRKIRESHFVFYWERKLFIQLLSYSWWNLFGSVAVLLKGQGLNVLLNMFFNPAVNASRGIAYQINGVINQFFSNFYTAVRPQITKYYAQGNLENMHKLVFQSSLIMYYLILLISLPIIIEAEGLIFLWLGQIPEYVVIFTQLIIVISAIDALSHPLMTSMQATGNIKAYQIVISSITILVVPISYLLLRNGASPIAVFTSSLFISCISHFIRLLFVRKMVRLSIRVYFRNVVSKIVYVTIFASLLPLILKAYLQHSIPNMFIICLICVCSTCATIWFLGLSRQDKNMISSFIANKLSRGKK